MAEGGGRFSIGTANCSGNGLRLPDDVPGPETRFGLLETIFMKTDVVLLQEIAFKRLITKELESTHHLYIPGNDTGIILKKTTFPKEPKFRRRADFQRDIDRVLKNDVELQIRDFTVAVATPSGWQQSVLFVSYHGPNTGTYDDRADGAIKFIELCNIIKKNLNATYVLIGGDINLPDDEFRGQVLPETNRYSNFRVASDEGGKVRTRGIIDYFIHEDTLRLENVTLKRISKDAAENNGIEYEKLHLVLDHDPVTAKVMISISQRSKSSPSSSQPAAKGTSYICDDCGDVFTSEHGVKTHLGMKGCKPKAKATSQEYECDDCGDVFTSERGVKIHQGIMGCRPKARATSQVEEYECHDCGNVFASERGVKIHQGKTGCGARPKARATTQEYECDDCGKVFASERGVKIHQGKMGCGPRPTASRTSNRCDGCGKTFKSSTGVKIHQSKTGCSA